MTADISNGVPPNVLSAINLATLPKDVGFRETSINSGLDAHDDDHGNPNHPNIIQIHSVRKEQYAHFKFDENLIGIVLHGTRYMAKIDTGADLNTISLLTVSPPSQSFKPKITICLCTNGTSFNSSGTVDLPFKFKDNDLLPIS